MFGGFWDCVVYVVSWLAVVGCVIRNLCVRSCGGFDDLCCLLCDCGVNCAFWGLCFVGCCALGWLCLICWLVALMRVFVLLVGLRWVGGNRHLISWLVAFGVGRFDGVYGFS